MTSKPSDKSSEGVALRPAREKSKGRRYEETNVEEEDEQRTPPKRQLRKRKDTPDPRQDDRRRTHSSSRSSSGSKSVSFEDVIPESSDSDEDFWLPPSQPKHYLKPPKFNGTTAFESFYAHFENCAKFNRWSAREQLAHLKASLTEEAAQVLWDSAESTNSLGLLVKLLRERFGGASQSDKYRMEIRGRRRRPNESLQSLHQDMRKLMVLAYPGLEPRESMACDYFLNSVGDNDLKLKIQERNPQTMSEALKIAQLLEVWSKDASQTKPQEKVKQRAVRVTESDEGTVHSLNQKVDNLAKGLQEVVGLVKQQRQTGPTVAMDKQNTGPCLNRQGPSPEQPNQALQAPPVEPARPPPARNFLRRQPPVCWTCGETGHVQSYCKTSAPDKAKACPVMSGQTRAFQRPSTYLDATIKGRPIQCLLDTGSDLTLAPYEFVKKHKCKLRPTMLKALQAANGTDIIIEGETVIPLHVAGRRVNTTALVSKDLAETILGIDWLQEHQCEWDFINGRVKFNQGDWIQLKHLQRQLCRRLYVKDDVLLQPKQQTVVPARATLIRPQWKPPISMIESSRLRPGVYIGRTLIPPQHDQAKVCVLNTSDKPQLLVKDTCLGNLQVPHAIETTAPEQKAAETDTVIPSLMSKLPNELDESQRSKVKDLLGKFEDIFSKNEFDVGRTHLVEYHIDTGDSRPIRQPLRRQPLKHLDAIDENVDAMLKHGIIEPAASPWASNVVIVTKKDGSLRFCVDYRAVNAVTYKDSYPLPLIDNCLNAMNGASWFSTLDLRAG